jgi:hypothetical protein
MNLDRLPFVGDPTKTSESLVRPNTMITNRTIVESQTPADVSISNDRTQQEIDVHVQVVRDGIPLLDT